MDFRKFLFTSIAFLLAASIVFAFQNDFPNTLAVERGGTDFTFVVTNNSAKDIDFVAEIVLPSSYQFVGLPKILKANASKEVKLTVFSKPELEGLNYRAKITFYAGDEAVSKKFTVAYNGYDAKTQNISTAKPQDTNPNNLENGLSGFVAFFNSNIEFAVITALILVAGVLLIAFISRFVKRISK